MAQRNLELCLPQLSPADRTALLHATLSDLGMMFVEFALAWMGSEHALARVPCAIEGLEHLDACRKIGKGVLLVGAHFSHLELCARLVSQRIRIAGMYRVMDDPAFEWSVLRARLRYADAMFAKDDLRATLKYLRRGGTVWYAPDQDMRGQGQRVRAVLRRARVSDHGDAPPGAIVGCGLVIPFFHKRNADGRGYSLRLEAPLVDFPGTDVVLDTARVNAQ